MRRILLLLVIGMASATWPGVACAGSPIYLDHTLTSYTLGSDSVTLDYVLHVENPGAATFYSLTLSYVPRMVISQDDFILDIGTIEAYEFIDIPFRIVTPMLLNEELFSELPLFWAGEGADSNKTFIEFPADSSANRGGM